MRGDRKQVQKKTGTEENGNLRCETPVEPLKGLEAGKSAGQQTRGPHPEQTDHRCREDMGEPEFLTGAALQRIGFARIPGREANEEVQRTERNRQYRSFDPAQFSGARKKVDKD